MVLLLTKYILIPSLFCFKMGLKTEIVQGMFSNFSIVTLENSLHFRNLFSTCTWLNDVELEKENDLLSDIDVVLFGEEHKTNFVKET